MCSALSAARVRPHDGGFNGLEALGHGIPLVELGEEGFDVGIGIGLAVHASDGSAARRACQPGRPIMGWVVMVAPLTSRTPRGKM